LSDFPCHLGVSTPVSALGGRNIVGLVLAQVAASAVVQHSAAKSREHLAGNGDQGHLEGDFAAMLMSLAPILISFSFRLNSEQRLISSSVASVRRKPLTASAVTVAAA
jgi:hypothetical protein